MLNKCWTLHQVGLWRLGQNILSEVRSRLLQHLKASSGTCYQCHKALTRKNENRQASPEDGTFLVSDLEFSHSFAESLRISLSLGKSHCNATRKSDTDLEINGFSPWDSLRGQAMHGWGTEGDSEESRSSQEKNLFCLVSFWWKQPQIALERDFSSGP